MRVLQIANHYTAVKLYKNMFSSLEKIGVENTVYVPVNVENKTTTHGDNEYKLIISPCFSNIDRILFYSKQKKILKDILSKIELKNIDIIHAHTIFSGGFAAYQLNKLYGIPYIVACRSTDLNVFFKYMIHLRHIGCNILMNAYRIIFLSPIYRERLVDKYLPAYKKDLFATKTAIIPNGIDDFWLKNIYVRDKSVDFDCLKLIFVGQISTNKGIDLLIKACKELIRQGYNVKLLMAGKIVEEKYRRLIEISSFIEYLGFLNKEDILHYMRESDVFVMPSRTETFGLVYAEAMSQGLPVIYTRGEGFDGQFEEGRVGYSVPKNDVKTLCSAILNARNNLARLSANCAGCVKKFCWNDIASSYKLIYQEATETQQ